MYQILNTKAGWVIQNTSTYVIVSIHASQTEAQRVLLSLTGGK